MEAVWEQYKEAMEAASRAFRKGKAGQAKELQRRAMELRMLAEQKDCEASRAIFRAKCVLVTVCTVSNTCRYPGSEGPKIARAEL